MTEAAGLARLAPEWQALVEACPTATVFQTYEWNAVWWRHHGRVPGRRLRVMTWRTQEGGTLLGLAPMMTGWWHGLPLRRLTFLGAGASDYHDLLALPGQETAVAEAFYAALGRQIADLSQLRGGGLLRQYLPPSHLRLQCREEISEACPYLPLPTDWDILSRTFSKKMRSNISYYDRALQKNFVVEIGPVTEPALLEAEMTRLYELHQRRWNQRWLPGVFGGRRVQAFHRDVARALLERDQLRLFTLKLDGETRAALYGFALGDRMCYYQAGFEPTLAKWSLGTVLIARALQTAIAEGRTTFDFLRGDEPYKAKWTQQAHSNSRRLVLPAGSPLRLFAQSLFNLELNTERCVKAWLRRR